MTTEEKIKHAARRVFMEKGFAATRTRDIAEAADINLALLNYYFRSKENLFELIMLDTARQFATVVAGIINDENTDLRAKLELLINHYIDLLIREPNLPIFILGEVRNNPEKFVRELGILEMVQQSVFIRQVAALMMEKQVKIHPMQYIISFIGLTVFPFIGKPMIQYMGNFDETEFNELMEARKKLIPVWINALLDQDFQDLGI